MQIMMVMNTYSDDMVVMVTKEMVGLMTMSIFWDPHNMKIMVMHMVILVMM